MLIIHNPYVKKSREFIEQNPDLRVLEWTEQARQLYPNISKFPSAVIRGKVITDFETVEDILAQSPPDAVSFFYSLQASPEYAAILRLAIDDPTRPVPFLTGIVIAAVSEAKNYQQSGGSDVSMERVEKTLTRLVQVLPEQIGEFDKADIIAKINEIATATYAGFTLDA